MTCSTCNGVLAGALNDGPMTREALCHAFVHSESQRTKMEEALKKIMRFNGSTGGPASLVREFKFIAQNALD